MDGTVLVTRLTVEILEMLLSRQIESAFNLVLEGEQNEEITE